MSVALRYLVTSACDGPFGSGLKSSHYVDEGARVVRLGNIGSAQWRDEDTAFVSLDYWRSMTTHHVSSGDVVVAGLGDSNNPVGRAAVVPDVGPAMVKADCFRLRLDPDRADARYLAYYLSSRGADYAAERAHGSTRQRLPLGEVLRLPVPEFHVVAQRRIADYLDTETARIDTLLAKTTEATTLVSERRASYLEASIWQDAFPRRRLSAVCDPSRPIRYGIVLPGPSVDDGVPLIKGGDVHRQTLAVGTDSQVDRDIEAAYPKSRVHPGDLVYTIRGSYGDVAVVPDTLPVANLTQDVARVAPVAVETEWLRLVLDAPSARAYADVVAGGATIKGVNIGDLRMMPIPVPDPDMRRQLIDSASGELSILRDVSGRLAAQRDLLRERRRAVITAAVTGEIEM